MTPVDGAGCGARGRRLVTAVPGRLRASCWPALRPVREVLSLDWDRRRRVTPVETASQEAWPGAEPWGPTSLWQEPWWNAGRRARLARRAPQPKGCGGYGSASFGVPLPFLCFLQSMTRKSGLRVFRKGHAPTKIVAQSADRDGAGSHRWRHLAKIGAESKAFVAFSWLANTARARSASRERSPMSSLPGLTRQSMRRSENTHGCRTRHVSMDHRVKPGGDGEGEHRENEKACIKWSTIKDRQSTCLCHAPRRRGIQYSPRLR